MNNDAGNTRREVGAEAPPPDPQGAPGKITRRRLLKGGLASAPVLMTIANRPAIAGGLPGVCKTPSAFGSINASPHGQADVTCSGRTPGYWKQSQWFSQWQAPCYPTDVLPVPPGHYATKFHSSTTGFNGSIFGTKTMLQVLGTGGGGAFAVGRHIAAALLNALAGLTPVLSVGTVRNIWNSYINNGYYIPISSSPAIKWYADDIVTYLKSTQPV
ncbi:MAG: hypothetical protein J0I91_14060 [Candidatus Accumulibacter sp.]|nr:hypothetical protein [Accumulibacter sp.]